MKTLDFQKDLRAFLDRKPFKPFLIELDDGETFVVGQPAAVNYREGETALYYHADGNINFVNSEAVRRIVELVPASAG
jgi:hypothetical protein